MPGKDAANILTTLHQRIIVRDVSRDSNDIQLRKLVKIKEEDMYLFSIVSASITCSTQFDVDVRHVSWLDCRLLVASIRWIENRKFLFGGHTYVILCTISYHFYNFRNVENTHGGVLLLVKLQPATLLNVTLIQWCFSFFLNCTNGTKSR